VSRGAPHPRWLDQGITFLEPGEVRPTMWPAQLHALGWDDEGLQRAADELGIPADRNGVRLDIASEVEGRPRLERRRFLFDAVIDAAMGNGRR
jgi:hypothetical protein